MTFPIIINGATIKHPTTFQISTYNLTTPGRLADSGLMIMDFIAKKKKLFLTYNAISGKELKVILDEIDTNEMFFEVKYYDTNGVQQTITAYVGEIPAVLHMRAYINDNNIWKNVNFNLIER
jgi:hypothetical protein